MDLFERLRKKNDWMYIYDDRIRRSSLVDEKNLEQEIQ